MLIKIDQVISELVELKQLYNENQKRPLDEDPYIKLRLMGFSKQVVESIKEKAGEEKIDSLIKRISKLFVSGKNKYFDESDVFIIVGQKSSGKSLFAQKFCSMLRNDLENREISQVDDKNSKKLFKAAKDSFFGKSAQALVIEKTNANVDLDFLFLELNKIKPDIKISVINTIAVGSSYDLLIKSIERKVYQS